MSCQFDVNVIYSTCTVFLVEGIVCVCVCVFVCVCVHVARNLDREDVADRRFSASICVSNHSGLSPVTIRRANSDKTSVRIPKILVSVSMADEDKRRRSVQRTPSVDYLDDR